MYNPLLRTIRVNQVYESGILDWTIGSFKMSSHFQHSTNGGTTNGMLLSAGGGPSSSRCRTNNLVATPMTSQYDLSSRKNMLRSNSSLASTNTVSLTTLKKNQSGDQLCTAKSERLIGHRSSYV